MNDLEPIRASNEPKDRVLVTVDGITFDESTGEIVEVAEKPKFAITDADSAEWWMARICTLDAAIAGLQSKRWAILANIDAEMRRLTARRLWMESGQYGQQLKSFAATQLRGKAKTYNTPYGSVGFRTSKERVEIADAAKAIAFLKRMGITAAIKTETKESVLLSECKDLILAMERRPGSENGIEIINAKEVIKVESGIKT